MATFTLSIPKELKEEMDNFSEVKFPEYVRKQFEKKITELKRIERQRK